MLYVNPIASSRSQDFNPGGGTNMREAEALEELERFFLYMLMREMRKTVPKSDLFGGSGQQQYFEEMMDDFVAGQMARSGQLGVADQIKAQLEAARPQPKSIPKNGIPLHERAKGLPLHPTAARAYAEADVKLAERFADKPSGAGHTLDAPARSTS